MPATRPTTTRSRQSPTGAARCCSADAAHAIGRRTTAGRSARCADVTTFSFFPTKNHHHRRGRRGRSPGTRRIAERARRFRNHGLVREPRPVPDHRTRAAWHHEVHDVRPELPAARSAVRARASRSCAGWPTSCSAARSSPPATTRLLADVDRARAAGQRDRTSTRLAPLRGPGPATAAAARSTTGMRAAGIGVQVQLHPGYWHPAFADLGYRRGMCPVPRSSTQQHSRCRCSPI